MTTPTSMFYNYVVPACLAFLLIVIGITMIALDAPRPVVLTTWGTAVLLELAMFVQLVFDKDFGSVR
ncbi:MULTISPECIES: hypothetical protein [Paraburkholderia]|uniref:hypothetical protein n=1 Tax=Paraburkholderia TaxID=1822464 RepID=UPI001F1E0B74|nr:hypothetical protein [Paraburkholderia tropica]